MQDSRFNTPSVESGGSVCSIPTRSDSAEEVVLTQLLAGWLNDSLNESLYPAWMAGQSFSAYPHARGMTLSFSGWRDGQTPLIEQAIDQLKTAEISEGAFAIACNISCRELVNAPQSSALLGECIAASAG